MAKSTTVDHSRVPPHDREAERIVLGCVIIDNDRMGEVGDTLTAKMFDYPAHHLIYEAALSLYQQDIPIDLIMLKDELEKRKTLDKVGGMAYVSGLVADVSAVTNVKHYARIVREKFQLRSMISAFSRVVDTCYEGGHEASQLVGYVQNVVYDIAAMTTRGYVQTAGELAGGQVELAEKIISGEVKMSGMPTGFKALDELLGGLHLGDLMLVGARPSVGKSALSCDIARNVAKIGIGVMLFSVEMSPELVGARLLCAEGGLNLHKFLTGYIGKAALPAMRKTQKAFAELPILIDGSSKLNPVQMRTRLKAFAERHKIGIAIVDYVQLMDFHQKTNTREEAVRGISRSLKTIAREMNICMIGVSQLKRPETKFRAKPPVLADLRESGGLEQDADVVVFLHNPQEEDTKSPTIEIQGKVAKQRNGPRGTFKLLFDKASATFKNLESTKRYDQGTVDWPNETEEPDYDDNRREALEA